MRDRQADELHSSPGMIVERALDVFVYLPAGAVLTTLEDVPEAIAKGRARVDQELRNAKVVGRFAVDIGLRQLKDQIDWFVGEGRRGARDAGGAGDAVDAGGTDADEAADGDRSAGRARTRTIPPPARTAPKPSRPAPASPSRDPQVDRAIPDYDILAASQVVRRLDGLGPDELRAVVRHERATRGRRTILQRAEQLLGPMPDSDARTRTNSRTNSRTSSRPHTDPSA